MTDLGGHAQPLVAHARALFDRAVEASDDLSEIQRSVIQLGVLACAGADTRLALREARSLGASQDLLEDLAAATYLSRGSKASEAISLVERAPSESTREVKSVPVNEILLEFAEVFGEVPEQVRLLADHAPAALQAYHLLRSYTIGSQSRHALTIELALFAVNAADLNTDFATVHALGARRRGASERQLVSTGLCVISVSGVASWRSASQAIVASREDETQSVAKEN